jgi:hypothetical protein
MRQPSKGTRLGIASFIVLTSLDASAQLGDEKQWFMSMDLQGLSGSYSGSIARTGLDNYGVFLHADYFERAGFTLGYNRTALDLAGNAADTEQDNLFLSARVGLTPDFLDGRITLRLDAYDVSNNVPSASADDASVAMSQVSYLNFPQTFYWDLGFARSDYEDSTGSGSGLEVDQLTLTIGFGLNEQRDWIQARAYLIDLNAPASISRQGDTSAIELKWTHALSADGFLGLETLRFSALAGERLFTVDPDAAAIYSLSDLQTGGFSGGGEWAIGENSGLMLIVGLENFENHELNDKYRSSFLYLNFSHKWN